jgi:hypothetical protein
MKIAIKKMEYNIFVLINNIQHEAPTKKTPETSGKIYLL